MDQRLLALPAWQTTIFLWCVNGEQSDDGPSGLGHALLVNEALGEPPREGAELAPLQISKHMRLSRVSFLFRMLGVSYSCVTERGRLLGVLTRLDVVEEEKERMSQPFLQRHDSPTVSLLGISRMSSTSGTSTSSSRTSSISLV